MGKRREVWGGGGRYRGLAALSGAGHLRCLLPGAAELQQVEKLRMKMFRLALHPLCSGSEPPDLGSCSPGLKLSACCLRSGPLPLGSHIIGDRSSLHRAGDVKDPGSARRTQGSAAAGRTRHAAPGDPRTGSVPPRAQSQLALTRSPVSLVASPPTGCGRSDQWPPLQAVLSPLPDRATAPHPRPPATIGRTTGGAGRGRDVD